MKTIDSIMKAIDLQPDIIRLVLSAYKKINMNEFRDEIVGLLDISTASKTWEHLKELLKPDEGNIKILAIMLYGLIHTYENYQASGIGHDIFVATMRCFPRFIKEHYEGVEKWAFDRDWWVYRQIAMQIFRLRELEYEMKNEEKGRYISIHIPSDAVFTPVNISDSLRAARTFFKIYFPDYDDVCYRCRSWLLSDALPGLLPAHSNILYFRSLFTIVKEEYGSESHIRWVYKKKYDDYHHLPEVTTLQRNMKQYLLAGGRVGVATGYLK